MNRFAIAALSTTLLCLPSLDAGQQPSNETSTQKSQDVPQQKPKTNNPDVGVQRAPKPKPHESEQHKNDVPAQKPTTNNPDLSDHHRAPKKSKTKTSTESSTH